MEHFGGQPVIYDLNPFEESSVQMHLLGARGETGDGRIFRYGYAGSGGITIGYLAVMPDQDTTQMTMAVTTTAPIGATSITFTNAATTATANEYAEGWVGVSYGTGLGQTLKISSHAAWTSGQTGAVVNLMDPVQVALATSSSKIDVTPNPYKGCLMVTTDAAVSVPCGVALRTVTASYYAWLQTRGVCAVFADATIAAGYEAQADVSVAGAIDVTGTDAQVWKIGHSLQATAQNYCHPIFLTID